MSKLPTTFQTLDLQGFEFVGASRGDSHRPQQYTGITREMVDVACAVLQKNRVGIAVRSVSLALKEIYGIGGSTDIVCKLLKEWRTENLSLMKQGKSEKDLATALLECVDDGLIDDSEIPEEYLTVFRQMAIASYRLAYQKADTSVSGDRMKSLATEIEAIFQSIPPLIFLIIIGLMAWQVAGRKIAIYSISALTLIGFVGAWKEAMVTLSLVVTAVAFCVAIGIPIGIACARSDRLVGFVRPLLDVMQTIPIFIYLVPVVMLFGIGKVPGAIATIIFALPPLIRLTNLGIRQVSEEVVEAAIAFGSTPWQVLWEAQIPLAMPTILTGLNQTILFALGMSVVTSMIAVPGLGRVFKVLDPPQPPLKRGEKESQSPPF